MSGLSRLHATYYKDKKVTVTGGAGFIGSHLVDRLVSYGAHVTVLDDLSTGSIDNLGESAAHIQFIPGSITNKMWCQKATTGSSHLFHLAAMVSVAQSCKEPEKCEKINVTGTKQLYEAAAKNGVQSIVFSSSAAVYGPRDTACVESDELNPISPYATSKLAGEQFGQELAGSYNIAVANLRYFNVHGPRQQASNPYSGVVATFTKRLRDHQPITFYGDGQQTRDFIHVDQVVTANLHAGMCHQLRGQSINVATGTSITLRQLLQNLESALNLTAADTQYQPARDGDIAHSAANITRLHRLLAYTPGAQNAKKD